MKFGIMELGDHYEYVYSVCKIFDCQDNDIYLIVDERVASHMREWLGDDYGKYSWLIKDESESYFAFMGRARAFVEKAALKSLLICTIPADFASYWHFLRNVRTYVILTLHNLNTWLKPEWSLRPFDLYNYLMVKQILRQVPSVAVLEENLKKYIEDNRLLDKPVFIFPYELSEGPAADTAADADTIRFVVPGTVQGARKDFEMVLDAFSGTFDPQSPVSLTLLGSGKGPYAHGVFQRCASLKERGYRISYYSDFVGESEFQRVMAASDCVLAPIQLNFEIGCNREIYGITKSTGSIFDMIRYGKPGIMPAEYQAPRQLASSIMQYKDISQLKTIMRQLVADKKLLSQLQANARRNAGDFIKEKFQPQVNRIKELANGCSD